MRRPVVASLTLFAALISSPAWAHPAFRPDEVPAGQDTEVELEMAHHCEQPSSGISPTNVVAIQIPDAIADVIALDKDGWVLTDGTSDSGAREIEWVAQQPTPDDDPPVFKLRVTPDTQQSATTVAWTVYQGCEEGSYLWGGGDEQEPPVNLTVSPGTYSAPTPTPTDPTPSPSASTVPSSSPSSHLTPTSTPAQAGPEGTTAAEGGGAGSLPWIVVAVALAVGGLALRTVRHRRSR